MTKSQFETIVGLYGDDLQCVSPLMLSSLQYLVKPLTQPLNKDLVARRRLAHPYVILALNQPKTTIRGFLSNNSKGGSQVEGDAKITPETQKAKPSTCLLRRQASPARAQAASPVPSSQSQEPVSQTGLQPTGSGLMPAAGFGFGGFGVTTTVTQSSTFGAHVTQFNPFKATKTEVSPLDSIGGFSFGPVAQTTRVPTVPKSLGFGASKTPKEQSIWNLPPQNKTSSVMKSVFTEPGLGDFVNVDCEIPTQLKKIIHCAAAHVNGFIFISGGDLEEQTTGSLYRYNCLANTWMGLCPMSAGRANHTLTANGGSLWAAGGQAADETYLDSTLIYDIAQDRWTPGPPLPRKTSEHAACSVQDRVYLSGGVGSCTTKQLLCLSGTTEEHTWEEKASMLTGRQCHTMVANGDTLIVCGGRAQAGYRTQESVVTVEIYDVNLDQWTEMASHPDVPFRSALGTCLNGHIYILGGFSGDDQRPLNQIQKYEVADDSWEVCKTELPAKGHLLMGFILS